MQEKRCDQNYKRKLNIGANQTREAERKRIEALRNTNTYRMNENYK